MLLREVVLVPGDELQAVMQGRPWHTFYTRVRQYRIEGLSYNLLNRMGNLYAPSYLDVDNRMYTQVSSKEDGLVLLCCTGLTEQRS